MRFAVALIDVSLPTHSDACVSSVYPSAALGKGRAIQLRSNVFLRYAQETRCVAGFRNITSPPSLLISVPESAKVSPTVLKASGLNEVNRVATMPNGHIKRRH